VEDLSREYKFEAGDLVDYPAAAVGDGRSIIDRVVAWFGSRDTRWYRFNQTVETYVSSWSEDIEYY
jgi:hypothetical protein